MTLNSQIYQYFDARVCMCVRGVSTVNYTTMNDVSVRLTRCDGASVAIVRLVVKDQSELLGHFRQQKFCDFRATEMAEWCSDWVNDICLGVITGHTHP
jgi:hypothetical protein